MSKNGEIYTTGKNFTLPPGLTGWTNSTSSSTVRAQNVDWVMDGWSGWSGYPCYDY